MNTTIKTPSTTPTVPKDRLAGLKENWKADVVSGFILFLIALPLSLGISIASGFPPLAGVFAAALGGLLCSQLGGSFVTITGPAAGLIVVILGSVERLGGGDAGYHCALAAIAVSGIILLILGLCRAGSLALFVPASAVHGMLAAIGLIIIAKELPLMLGVKAPAKAPLELFAQTPHMLMTMNPEIALIGFVSLAILIVHALIKHKVVKAIPAPMLVVVVATLMSAYFGFGTQHEYSFAGQQYLVNPDKCLVRIPSNVLEGITFPDFSKIASGAFWFSVMSITLVQGVETLLTVAAVDRLDPFHRKSNWSKDLGVVGSVSTLSACIGGLPMISEIVRSMANISTGAKTRWANFFHGSFMIVFVFFGAAVIQLIPLSALAALLIFTGYRLASPRVFKQTHQLGKEQTAVFLITIVATLATDLLIGVGVGILAKLLLHIFRGAPIKNLFVPDMSVVPVSDEEYLVTARGAFIFSNFIATKNRLDKIPKGKRVQLDLSKTKLIDHTVMDHLHHYAAEYAETGGQFKISGLDQHSTASQHPLAARRLRLS
jgi:MFS superfamily sulfate permease-like transporter